MKTYTAIGVMSGTSLDGLDMLHVCFTQSEAGTWRYAPGEAMTVSYPAGLHARLAGAMQADGMELSLLHADYGHFVGKCLLDFIRKYDLRPDFAAVHGHTVFHRPERKMTLQIGDGAAMAAESGLLVVNNFRNTDIALGGQGAPLVPIGDELLFADYDFCLNLGGIANISYRNEKGNRIAYDISPCNMALNHYAARMHAAYDRNGRWARKGNIVAGLKERLDNLEFYLLPPPKSLGREWFEEIFLPVLAGYETARTEDILHTLVEHIAGKIAMACRTAPIARKKKPCMLLTGGGALNLYLRERIEAVAEVELAAVDKKIIDYKEALIFAFLGVLRLERQCNCLSTVTGANRDNIGGAVYMP